MNDLILKRTAKGIALLLILGLCGTVATAGLMAAPVDAVAKKPSGSVSGGPSRR